DGLCPAFIHTTPVRKPWLQVCRVNNDSILPYGLHELVEKCLIHPSVPECLMEEVKATVPRPSRSHACCRCSSALQGAAKGSERAFSSQHAKKYSNLSDNLNTLITILASVG